MKFDVFTIHQAYQAYVSGILHTEFGQTPGTNVATHFRSVKFPMESFLLLDMV